MQSLRESSGRKGVTQVEGPNGVAPSNTCPVSPVAIGGSLRIGEGDSDHPSDGKALEVPSSVSVQTSLDTKGTAGVTLRGRQDTCGGGVKIAFIIAHTRNNVVVLFGTLKVQSFMLTEVRD